MSPSKSEDLLPLLTKAATQNQPLLSGMGQPGSLTSFGQGRILTWNPSTFENSVAYRGGVLTNLPVMSGPDALTYKADDIVSIQSSSPNGGAATHWIAGRIIIPGPGKGEEAIAWMTSELGRRIAAAVFAERIGVDLIFNSESRTNSSFGDLATVGPTVSEIDVTDAGQLIVFMSSRMDLAIGGFDQMFMSVDLDGPSPSGPSFNRAVHFGTPDAKGASMSMRAASIHVYEGLNSGSYKITSKYVANGGSFSERLLVSISF